VKELSYIIIYLLFSLYLSNLSGFILSLKFTLDKDNQDNSFLSNYIISVFYTVILFPVIYDVGNLKIAIVAIIIIVLYIFKYFVHYRRK